VFKPIFEQRIEDLELKQSQMDSDTKGTKIRAREQINRIQSLFDEFTKA